MVNFTGKKSLSDVVKLFDKDVLKQLKSECGGLQTLLRNHNSVFNGKIFISLYVLNINRSILHVYPLIMLSSFIFFIINI